MTTCGICLTSQTEAAGWTQWQLTAAIQWRSRFTSDVEDLPATAAGTYDCCPDCSTWLLDPRGRPMPESVTDYIGLHLPGSLDPMTRRKLRADFVGMVRYLAEHLEPM
jgi:hypothetical protein